MFPCDSSQAKITTQYLIIVFVFQAKVPKPQITSQKSQAKDIKRKIARERSQAIDPKRHTKRKTTSESFIE